MGDLIDFFSGLDVPSLSPRTSSPRTKRGDDGHQTAGANTVARRRASARRRVQLHHRRGGPSQRRQEHHLQPCHQQVWRRRAGVFRPLHPHLRARVRVLTGPACRRCSTSPESRETAPTARASGAHTNSPSWTPAASCLRRAGKCLESAEPTRHPGRTPRTLLNRGCPVHSGWPPPPLRACGGAAARPPGIGPGRAATAGRRGA